MPEDARRRRTAALKVSPLRGMTVDGWLKAKVRSSQSQLIRRLIRLVSAAAPEATISIKWGQPVYQVNGPMIFIKPFVNHVNFGFWRGADLLDREGLLEGSGSRMRHVKLRRNDDIRESAFRDLIRQAVALNRKDGDPTKSRRGTRRDGSNPK
jgi:hypothetical protein